MSITLRGQVLNQRQLDAITPAMNDFMHGKIKGQKRLEEACMAALEKAGCPLGYDTGLSHTGTVAERAGNWIVNGQVGSSSRAIYSHMMGLEAKGGFCHPHDPDDLNRCLLLLDLIPEWKSRMPEMAARSPQWRGLAGAWEEITATFLREAGLDWCKSNRAPDTYRLMQQAAGGDTCA